MSLIQVLKKQGGLNLIKQYIKAGVLGTAIGEFLILGKGRTALEILRLSTEYKTKRKLEKKYSKYLLQFEKEYDDEVPHIHNNTIWICWFQGLDNAPLIVKRCIESIEKNLSDNEIVILTADNMYQYVTFPNHIQKKIDDGIIRGAHLSDLLRLELLTKYGGTWIDATVYCSGGDIPDYMLNSELFMFQCMKPGKDGHATVVSSWFISAYSYSKILCGTKYLLYLYWENNNYLLDYFLVHDMFQIVIDKYADEWNRVIPRDNSTPHILLLRLFDKYDDKIWNGIKQQVPFHKLTYKFEIEQENERDTYYHKLILNK